MAGASRWLPLLTGRPLVAVLFLFNKGPDVVLENLQTSAGFSSLAIRLWIAKAFTLDAKASILKAR